MLYGIYYMLYGKYYMLYMLYAPGWAYNYCYVTQVYM